MRSRGRPWRKRLAALVLAPTLVMMAVAGWQIRGERAAAKAWRAALAQSGGADSRARAEAAQAAIERDTLGGLLLVALSSLPAIGVALLGRRQAAPTAAESPAHLEASPPDDLPAALRAALAAGAVEVHYQPQAALSDGSLRCIHAAACWQRSGAPALTDSEVRATAAAAGIAADLDAYVIARAATQFLHWRTALGVNAPQALAVTLAGDWALAADGAETLRQMLGRTGLAPRRLRLEVPEALWRRTEGAVAGLRAVAALGVVTVLAEFGQASLALLQRRPAAAVKLAPRFAAQTEAGSHQRLVIEGTARLAASLGMDLVVDGVESLAQREAVRLLGSAWGQGQALGPRLDAAAWTQRWAAGRVRAV